MKKSILALVLLLAIAGCTPTEEQPTVMEKPDLAGTSWEWSKTELNNGEVTTPITPEVFILSFDQEGRVSSKTDCNSISGTYTASEGSLTFGPFMSTKMFCPDSQEQEYAADLAEVASYFVQDEKLYLELKYDSGSIVFTPVATQ
jgi:heat shock protein HslJ